MISNCARFFCIALLSILSTNAIAYECPIELKMGLLIAPDHIRVMDMGRTQVQINEDQYLFIRGEQVPLNDEQTELLKEFSLGLRKELPEIVAIAMDSMELGFSAMDQVIKSIAGTDAAKGLKEHFGDLRAGLLSRFARSGDNFYIAPQGLNELERFFKQEISNQVQEVITGSLKIMLSAMGDAYSRSESAIEGTQVDVDDQLDVISNDVERALKVNGDRLAAKANAFCQRFTSLDATEARLQKQIPLLYKYDILANQDQQAN